MSSSTASGPHILVTQASVVAAAPASPDHANAAVPGHAASSSSPASSSIDAGAVFGAEDAGDATEARHAAVVTVVVDTAEGPVTKVGEALCRSQSDKLKSLPPYVLENLG